MILLDLLLPAHIQTDEEQTSSLPGCFQSPCKLKYSDSFD